MELQEKFLHHIWDQRHLIADLRTISGKPIKIIYQGQYNTSNGPDFKNVILNLDGETLSGDVEIHLKTYDWTAHEHQEDPAYNNTILHVVLEHKSNQDYTVKEDAGKVEILEIKNQIDADIAKLFANFDAHIKLPHAGICDFFKLSSKEQLIPLFQMHSWERFSRKCQRYNAELHFDGFDQLLYNGFMEAVGYDKNKFNTLSIAHHFRWDVLSEWIQKGLDSITLASIWLNYGTLMDRAEKILTANTLLQIRIAFEEQNFTADKGAIKWNFFRIRPANHPVRRILQASQFIIPFLRTGFLNTLLTLFEKSENAEPKQIISQTSTVMHKSENQIPGIESIGKVLQNTIIGNIYLPILYLYAEKTHNKILQLKVKDVYFNFPPQGSNHITNFMRGYLDPEQWKWINASYSNQQALMNIYYKFCNYRLCELCFADKEKILLEM